MPRDHSRVNLAIWNDDDFRALPPLAQHLWFVIWTHPDLSYAGVVDWRPGRIAKRAGGWTVCDVRTAAACLEHRLFVVIDDDTEELLMRSFVRWDGLMKQPIMAVSFANAHATVASPLIRGVIVHEALRLRERQPQLPGWGKPQVQQLLAGHPIDPRSRDLPADPYTTPNPGANPAPTPPAKGYADPSANPGPNTPPTPTPSPTPSLPTTPDPEGSATDTKKKARAARLPASWAPTDEHRKRATDAHLDIEREATKFRAHAEETGRTAQSWNGAFTRWLMNAEEFAANRPGAARPALRAVGNQDWLYR